MRSAEQSDTLLEHLKLEALDERVNRKGFSAETVEKYSGLEYGDGLFDLLKIDAYRILRSLVNRNPRILCETL